MSSKRKVESSHLLFGLMLYKLKMLDQGVGIDIDFIGD